MAFAQKHAQASKVNIVSVELTRRKVLQKIIILSSKCRETQRSSMTPQNGFNQGAEQGVHPWPPRRPHCLLPLHPWGRRLCVSSNTPTSTASLGRPTSPRQDPEAVSGRPMSERQDPRMVYRGSRKGCNKLAADVLLKPWCFPEGVRLCPAQHVQPPH